MRSSVSAVGPSSSPGRIAGLPASTRQSCGVLAFATCIRFGGRSRMTIRAERSGRSVSPGISLPLRKSDTMCRRIIVAAHSSGAYVAHALLQDLYDGAGIDSAGVTFGKIVYFNLDGGIGAGGSGVLITQKMVDRLVHVYGVYAFDPTYAIYSPNKAEMVDLGALFGSKSSSMEISARGCGCTGIWCVHETLINQRPYNTTTFDLKNDYGNINAAHPVTTKYLDVVTGIGAALPGTSHPDQFRLEQNYPNPFNSRTSITFQLSAVIRIPDGL